MDARGILTATYQVFHLLFCPRRVPHPRSRARWWGGGGGTPSQVHVQMGGTPSQVQIGGYPIPGPEGVPHPWLGYAPIQTWLGYPHLRLDGGTPLSSDGGTPIRTWLGYPNLNLVGVPIPSDLTEVPPSGPGWSPRHPPPPPPPSDLAGYPPPSGPGRGIPSPLGVDKLTK